MFSKLSIAHRNLSFTNIAFERNQQQYSEVEHYMVVKTGSKKLKSGCFKEFLKIGTNTDISGKLPLFLRKKLMKSTCTESRRGRPHGSQSVSKVSLVSLPPLEGLSRLVDHRHHHHRLHHTGM